MNDVCVVQAAVIFFHSGNHLTLSPDDPGRMCNWLFETKFLAEDVGPARSA